MSVNKLKVLQSLPTQKWLS